MHRIATKNGALDTERSLEIVQQTPGDVIFISAADTDLTCVAQTWEPLFQKRLRVTHAAALQKPSVAEDYVERILSQARLVILRLLGGKSYFPHLIEELLHLRSHEHRPQILILPGTDSWDNELFQYGDYNESLARLFFGYFKEGGLDNIRHAGEGVQLLLEKKVADFPPVITMPKFGWYQKETEFSQKTDERPLVWVCFYRAWYQTGDLAVIERLKDSLGRQGFRVALFYAYSLRNQDAQEALLEEAKKDSPRVILTLQSFSICINDGDRVSFLETLGCPVLQVPVSSQDRESWSHNPRGFSPSDVAMNVALPEIDGRVMTTVIGFKEEHQILPEVEYTIKNLQPDMRQVDYVAKLAKNWASLKTIPHADKKVAIILANYPNKNSRIGNGVGLDTPASVVIFMKKLKKMGYWVEEIPEDSEALMNLLQSQLTNDGELSYGKPCEQGLSRQRLDNFLETLPEHCRNELAEHWPQELPETIPVPGKQFGNVFVGIQPPRGFGIQTQAIYHSPDLPPPPAYLNFYLWIREGFQADAVIHFGKHGNLEWLPGRSVTLGQEDFPQICIGTLPHLYPFIVNDPGEGTQAKRRTSAMIVDHLTPPLTRAGLYDELDRIERLLEEHAHCETLFPERAHELEHEIEHLLEDAPWRQEIPEEGDLISSLGNYLCEIKESQIRSGLHVFGQNPEEEQKIDFLLSLLRMPSAHYPGLLEALTGREKEFDLSTLPGAERDQVDQQARQWIRTALEKRAFPEDENESLKILRQLLYDHLHPRLMQCENEIENLADGLSGKFIPPGPSGAPTRGRIDVLPTGRNFFSIDPRVIPTPTSWNCGKQMAERLLERHLNDHGAYPRNLAMVIWGTSNMRTGGDDIAQALWLWGCEPVWERVSGRIIDFEIYPAHLLGRPRVDVLLRVSGLFRDAFGDTMRLLATIPKRLANLDEPEELNPIRAAWLRDQEKMSGEGVSVEESERLAYLRVFSSGPGSYGTGLLPLIDGGNWESREDLARVFLKWGGYAYDTDGSSSEQTGLFENRLGHVEVVHQNQDNREHDILDSDDYFQFQGGLHAAVETIRGEAPVTYHGDSSQPDRVKVRTLSEEFNRVFRSRVLNPRWIEAMKKHGYKGAFEMAATADYIFGYDATCDVVADYQYEELAQKLFLDQEQQEFFKRYNPVALQDSVKRLLEAHERGLWKEASAETVEALELNLIELEGQLE
ncbi:MAG: cobaltochelatase subunit CobN [SAR324 cluster bacterium]|nr:cobaltochelatase subunit CobN [SAR324 cluster bacterium]